MEVVGRTDLYFDNMSIIADDRGELWFVGDEPSWLLIASYTANPKKLPATEAEDLSSYTSKQSAFQLRFVFTVENAGTYRGTE